jgi:photosystem II stability/assembly factor-like uncharacterized protein
LTAHPKDNKGAFSVYAFPDDPDKVLGVFTDNQLYRSFDGGSNWTVLPLMNPNGKVELSVANVTGNTLTNHPSQLYAAARGGIYSSRDGGISWARMSNSPAAGHRRQRLSLRGLRAGGLESNECLADHPVSARGRGAWGGRPLANRVRTAERHPKASGLVPGAAVDAWVPRIVARPAPNGVACR